MVWRMVVVLSYHRRGDEDAPGHAHTQSGLARRIFRPCSVSAFARKGVSRREAALLLCLCTSSSHRPTTTEAWLRLYSVRRQAVVWEGFLPWVAPTTTPTNTASTQQQRGSWQVDVRALAPVWAHFTKALPTAATSALESLSQLVDDWVVVLVVVGRDEEEDCSPDDNDGSSTSVRHHDTTARLVTCTQGVALSQRQHFLCRDAVRE
jgi:hypothetical protein